MVKEVIDKGKEVASKTKDFIGKVKGAIKALSTPVGQVIGVICLGLSGLVFLFIAVKIIINAVDIFLNDDYAGLSSYSDYEVVVGTFSSTGYDAYVSEEKWQDFASVFPPYAQ